MQKVSHPVKVKDFCIGDRSRLTVISGPCSIESEEHAFFCAEHLKEIAEKLPVNFIFKASYDKANRTSLNSFRGCGMSEGLRILKRIKEELDLPIISDVHSVEEIDQVAAVCDILQIPAFLCRQTDLIVKAAQTGLPLHVKKGQFLSPYGMGNIVDKIRSQGNESIILTDRGFVFGYSELITDIRSMPIMRSFGTPVGFDASHSVQRMAAKEKETGGDREFIPYLAKAAVAAGCDLIFIESHPNPEQAKSDKDCVYPLDTLPTLLEQLVDIFELVNRHES